MECVYIYQMEVHVLQLIGQLNAKDYNNMTSRAIVLNTELLLPKLSQATYVPSEIHLIFGMYFE